MSFASKLLFVSNNLRTAGLAQNKLEKLLPLLIKDTIFQNRIYISGGYVRDFVKGVQSNDLDLVVQLNGGSKLFSEYLISLFDGYVVYEMLNPHYPTYNIKFKENIVFDNALYQVKDSSLDISDTSMRRFPQDSNREKLFIYGNLYQDAIQRDFTINTLFKNVSTGKIVDLTGYGVKDIKDNLLRTIPGINRNRLFYDNPKVMLRFCRFFAKYQMKYIEQDVQYMRTNSQRILTLTQDSIIKQLGKVDDSFKQPFIQMAKNIGVYQYIEKYF